MASMSLRSLWCEPKYATLRRMEVKSPALAVLALTLVSCSGGALGHAQASSAARSHAVTDDCAQELGGKTVASEFETTVAQVRSFWPGGLRPVGKAGPLADAFQPTSADARAKWCWTADGQGHYTAWAVLRGKNALRAVTVTSTGAPTEAPIVN